MTLTPHRVRYAEPSQAAARRHYRQLRRSRDYADVRIEQDRPGATYYVSAVKVCTVCREPIDGPTATARDAELMRHWRECEGITPGGLP